MSLASLVIYNCCLFFQPWLNVTVYILLYNDQSRTRLLSLSYINNDYTDIRCFVHNGITCLVVSTSVFIFYKILIPTLRIFIPKGTNGHISILHNTKDLFSMLLNFMFGFAFQQVLVCDPDLFCFFFSFLYRFMNFEQRHTTSALFLVER